MRSASIPAFVVIGAFALAGLAPLFARLWGRRAGYPIALGYAVGAILLGLTPVLDGETLATSVQWIPALDIRLTFVTDGLGLLFAFLVLGIGALVMAYSAGYFADDDDMGRFYGLLCLFGASMLGLVLAGDAILLFVFWELTSVTSFFLIAGDGGARQRPATRALLVTGGGGLALLAGLLLMATEVGSFELAAMTAGAEQIATSAAAPAIFLLILLGAGTKSAQVPFHFWLRGAMVAPTPTSTYLHAATMVKAGVYLLARFAPLLAASGVWRHVIVFVGLTTSVVGAAQALKQVDLKALLAYSTVSQLGLMVALAGVATFEALVALTVVIVAHALYKSTAFMVTGIVDKQAGSRDLRELSRLRSAMPLTAGVALLAVLSMAGIPLFLGFVGKEEGLGVLLDGLGGGFWSLAAVAGAVVSAALTFAYAARLYHGVFGGGPARRGAPDPSVPFLAPAAVAAVAGLLLGVLVALLDPLVAAVASSATLETGSPHLALWHGIGAPLLLSLAAIGGGTALFLWRGRVDALAGRIRFETGGAESFDRLYQGAVDLGRTVGEPFLSWAPVRHLTWVLVTLIAVALGAWRYGGILPDAASPQVGWIDWAVAAVVAAGCLFIVQAKVRLAAVALLGLVGFLVAVIYVLFGAPDLAITQLLIETLTIALVVFVFRRLPPIFREVRRIRLWLTGSLAVAVGLLAGAGTYLLTGRREASEAALYFLEAAPRDAGADNVVNAILVDFRALDTLGEITVLAIGAVGVFALVRIARRRS